MHKRDVEALDRPVALLCSTLRRKGIVRYLEETPFIWMSGTLKKVDCSLSMQNFPQEEEALFSEEAVSLCWRTAPVLTEQCETICLLSPCS